MKIVVDNGGINWLTPAATLLAVLVGGLLTWLAQSRLEARRAATESKSARARRAAEDEVAARVRESEEMAAARVIQGDLSIVASQLREIVAEGRWFGYMDLAFPHWQQLQTVLARRLDNDAWEVVSQAALSMRFFEAGLRRAVGPGGPHEGVNVLPLGRTSESSAQIRAARAQVTAAWNELCSLTGVAPVEGLIHGDEASTTAAEPD